MLNQHQFFFLKVTLASCPVTQPVIAFVFTAIQIPDYKVSYYISSKNFNWINQKLYGSFLLTTVFMKNPNFQVYKNKLLQDRFILSLIFACHRFGLTEVFKNVALHRNDFHIVVWSAFLGN